MHSFKAAVSQPISLTNPNVYGHPNSPFYFRADEIGRDGSRFSDLGELEQSTGNGFHHADQAVNLSTSSIYNDPNVSSVSVLSNNMHFGGLNNGLVSADLGSPAGVDTGHFMSTHGGIVAGVGGGAAGGAVSLVNGQQFETWCDSGVVADHSQQTNTSTDTEDKNQFPGAHNERLIVVDSVDQSKGKIGDQKVIRRLAQNREAARKSRIRKKAYVQQLESSRQKLAQLEQDQERARQQGTSVTSGFSGDQSHSTGGNGALSFDLDYARWLDEHQRLIHDLRSAVNSRVSDGDLRLLVGGVVSHYDEIFRLKRIGAKSNIFHILSGTWKNPAERCFMWLGGFRSSEVLKIPGYQIEPLTDQQLAGICNLRQSSQQAEDALSQGMEALQQSLVETLSSISLGSQNSGYVAEYMGQMEIAMSKLASLEDFLHQADLLRQQTLQQLQRILSTRQAARALLAIYDYKSRLQALSSLWLARPKE